MGAPTSPNKSPVEELGPTAGKRAPSPVSRNNQLAPQATAASQSAVSATTMENVIATSQSIASIVASLKISLTSLPLLVESGLKIAILSWSRPTISGGDATSQPVTMGPALLVTQNLRERYPVFVYRLVPYHDFFHVTRTSVTIANDGLPPPPLVDGMPMALMA